MERGGQLIDQSHTAIRQLAGRLGLQTDNLLQAEPNGAEPLYYFDGQPYSYVQATDDLKTIWQQLHNDVSAASYPTLYNLSTPRGRELDRISILDWIQAYVPGGIGSRGSANSWTPHTRSNTAPRSRTRAPLNLLYLLGYTGPGQFRVFGKSNEKFHVRGGNDQIVSGLAASVAGQIKTGSELVKIRRNGSGTFALTFKQDAKTESVTADHVVLALPFSLLRSSVDWTSAGFSALKATAIGELGMGMNSKLHIQFDDRFWADLGSTGETYSDRMYQSTWEVTRAQPGASGILVNYTGGTYAASFGSGAARSRASQFLTQIEPVLPGATDAWNGRATIDFWLGNPWTKGSYSYWKVGQYTKFAGVEGKREGNCHFAGEHTSIDFEGYLNGAVETGERAAQELLSAANLQRHAAVSCPGTSSRSPCGSIVPEPSLRVLGGGTGLGRVNR